MNSSAEKPFVRQRGLGFPQPGAPAYSSCDSSSLPLTIDWLAIDRTGVRRGQVFRDGRAYGIVIDDDPQCRDAGGRYEIFVDGKRVGALPSFHGAVGLVRLYFAEARHCEPRAKLFHHHHHQRRKEDMAGGTFEWRGEDGAGFHYGFYREGKDQYRLDIAIPGKGLARHPGPDYKIFVDGDPIGSSPDLKSAMKVLSNHFDQGRHKARDRASLTDKLASAVGLKSKGRGR